MKILISAQEEILVGAATVIEVDGPEPRYAVVFEDDCETGYFYALDNSSKESTIQDSLYIYDVSSVTDRALPSLVQIGWSKDGQQAGLLINGYLHAVFDFPRRKGYCRTGFGSALKDSQWSSNGHEWDDSVGDMFM